MAELHVLGQISHISDCLYLPPLFCRYSFQSGRNWTVISGCPEGQTVSGKLDHNNLVTWSHPLDIHYITKGIQGWPKLALEVCCLDFIGRYWTVAYSSCSLPAVPGHHTLEVPCWAPAAVKLFDKLRQYFIGGSHQIIRPQVVNLGVDRFKLSSESKGNITLEIDLILKNFKNFGVEYV